MSNEDRIAEVENLVEEICDMIDNELSESSYYKAAEFFDDVRLKAVDIGESVAGRQSATDKQIQSLTKMRDGVAKWIR